MTATARPTAYRLPCRRLATAAPAAAGTAAPGAGTAHAFTAIAHLANLLCEDLTDSPWRIAAQIRDIAETAQGTTAPDTEA
ncbi:hypothetical protein ACQEVX_04880 [Streptomyces syringium]|uniref:hypothetical protein n=1 Tax=Streptomyces syringium TaxID=76729 RepID=UPI003D930F44